MSWAGVVDLCCVGCLAGKDSGWGTVCFVLALAGFSVVAVGGGFFERRGGVACASLPVVHDLAEVFEGVVVFWVVDQVVDLMRIGWDVKKFFARTGCDEGVGLGRGQFALVVEGP